MSDPGGPRFTGVIVARVGSSVEYVGNTPGHPASRDDFGRNPFAGGACLCVMLKELGGDDDQRPDAPASSPVVPQRASQSL
jgi:hypothetical protein